MQARPKRRKTSLASIHSLLEEIGSARNFHEGLSELFRDHTFVGCVDANKCAIQHRLNLYLVDVPAVTKHFFYEQILEGFESFEPMTLSNPPGLEAMIKLHLQVMRSQTRFETLSEEKQTELLQTLTGVLNQNRRNMLKEYLAIEITDDLKVRTLPILLSNYVPDLSCLPRFLFRLCSKINYNNELDCFRTLGLELADFYAPAPLDPAIVSSGAEPQEIEERNQRNHNIENVIFNAIKAGCFKAPRELAASGAVTQIASITQLYKCFERC
jgi:DNA mismatch repair protein MLH1